MSLEKIIAATAGKVDMAEILSTAVLDKLINLDFAEKIYRENRYARIWIAIFRISKRQEAHR